MRRFNTTEDALKWLADVFQESPANIRPETPRERVEGWDSLGMLDLMARLDEECNIILSEEHLSELKKIDDILNILRMHGCLNSTSLKSA